MIWGPKHHGVFMINILKFTMMSFFICIQSAFATVDERVVTKEMKEEIKSLALYFQNNPMKIESSSEINESIFMQTQSNRIIFYQANNPPITVILHSLNPTIVSIDDQIIFAGSELKTQTNFKGTKQLFNLTTRLSEYLIGQAHAEWGGFTRNLYEGVSRGVEQNIERWQEASGRLGIPSREVLSGDTAGTYSYNSGSVSNFYYHLATNGKILCFYGDKAVDNKGCDANGENFFVSRGNDNKRHCYMHLTSENGPVDDKFCGYSVLRSDDNNTYCYSNVSQDKPVDSKLCGYMIARSRDNINYCYLRSSTNAPVDKKFCGFQYLKCRDGKFRCFANISFDDSVDDTFCGIKSKKVSSGPDRPKVISVKVVPVEKITQIKEKNLTEKMNEEFSQYQCLLLDGAQGVTAKGKNGISIDKAGNISLCNENSCNAYTPGSNPDAVLTNSEASASVLKFQLIESSGQGLIQKMVDYKKTWDELSLPDPIVENVSYIESAFMKIKSLEDRKKTDLKAACSKLNEGLESFKSNILKNVSDESLNVILDSMEIKSSDLYCVTSPHSQVLNEVIAKAKSLILKKQLVVNEVQLANSVELLKEYAVCCSKKSCINSIEDNAKEQKSDIKVMDGKRDAKVIKSKSGDKSQKGSTIPK